LLQRRAELSRPVRVGVIGAGKFAAMFLSQARLTPGIQVVGVADLQVQRAREALKQTGWPEARLVNARTTGQINDAATQGQVALTEDALALIGAELEIIIECTGSPEAGTKHALRSIEAGRHVIMVTVEADVLVGPVLARRADNSGVVYSMAYGD